MRRKDASRSRRAAPTEVGVPPTATPLDEGQVLVVAQRVGNLSTFPSRFGGPSAVTSARLGNARSGERPA